MKPGKWSVELGAAFSFLASLRHTGDYGGASHVVAEEAPGSLREGESDSGGRPEISSRVVWKLTSPDVAGEPFSVGAASTENVFVDESPWDERPQGVLSEGSSSVAQEISPKATRCVDVAWTRNPRRSRSISGTDPSSSLA